MHQFLPALRNFKKREQIFSCSFYFMLFQAGLLMSISASALTINVQTNRKEVVEMASLPTARMFAFCFHPVEVNGKIYERLQAGKVHCDLEERTIKLKTSKGEEKVLPGGIAERLLKILREGWKGHVNWSVAGALGGSAQVVCENPPAQNVMYYLAFGSDVTPDTPMRGYPFLLPTTLGQIAGQLSVGELIVIHGSQFSGDHEAVIYLGSNLFLIWDHVFGAFHVQGAEDIEQDFPQITHIQRISCTDAAFQVLTGAIAALWVYGYFNGGQLAGQDKP